MPNFTSRLGLTQPLTSEFYDISVQNGNMAIIDAAPANVTICTSSTRPSTPDDGDLIYETDTLNVLLRHSGSWKSWNGKVFLCTSSTRPASGASFPGMVIYETDTLNLTVRNSGNTAWLQVKATGNQPTLAVFVAQGLTVWTKPAGLVAVVARVQGVGGAGGGAAGTAGNGASGGGGGGGGYAEKWFAASSLSATENVTIGTPGAAATAGANSGGSGSATSFATGQGYAVTGNGGSGGAGGASGGGSFTYAAGGAGGTATGGDFNSAGEAGGNGVLLGGVVSPMNRGGSSYMGRGGGAPTATGTGNAGTLRGAGSSGATRLPTDATAQASLAGANGIVLLEQYF